MTTTKKRLSLHAVARVLGCSEDQALRQFAKNAKQLRDMLERAKTTKEKVNGYTAGQLQSMVEEADSRAATGGAK